MRSLLNRITLAALIAVPLAVLCGFTTARAAAPYQGIYVIIDPYTQSQLQLLKTAAQTPCIAGQPNTISPFCAAANGILLRIAWCDFQLYHISAPAPGGGSAPVPSCHYTLRFTGAVGSMGQQQPTTDTPSPCPGTFDICSGHNQSVLGQTLRAIVQINQQRSAARLPPLKLSVGLYAGVGTPQSVLDSTGFVDQPYNLSVTGDPTQVQCYRLPLSWKPQFLSQYDAAIDQLLQYIPTQMPQGSNIVIFKVAATTAADLEITMPGQSGFVAAPTDPGPVGPGGPVACPTSGGGAQVWLNAYNLVPVGTDTLSQANEAALGSAVGHTAGVLANDGLPNTLLSLAITNARTYPGVDCGTSGALPCHTQTDNSGWTNYYLELYVDDLFNRGLAYTAAASAYSAIRSDTFSLPASRLSINWTGLSPVPLAPAYQITCGLNNIIQADANSFRLDQQTVVVLGAGTGIGWQTATNQGGLCAGSSYGTMLQDGITQGGLYLEVETDAAFTNLAQCAAPLSSALTQILAAVPPTSCVY